MLEASSVIAGVCLAGGLGLVLNLSLLRLGLRMRAPDNARPFLHVFLAVNCVTSGLLAPLDALQLGLGTPRLWSPLCVISSSLAGVICVSSALLVISAATYRLWELRNEEHRHHHPHPFVPKLRPVGTVEIVCALAGGCLLTLPFVFHSDDSYSVFEDRASTNGTLSMDFDCIIRVGDLVDRYYVIQTFLQACVVCVAAVTGAWLYGSIWRHKKWADSEAAKEPKDGTKKRPVAKPVLEEQEQRQHLVCDQSSACPSSSLLESLAHVEDKKSPCLSQKDDAPSAPSEEQGHDSSPDGDKTTSKPEEPEKAKVGTSTGHAHTPRPRHFSVGGELFGDPAHTQHGDDVTQFLSHAQRNWRHASAPPLRPHPTSHAHYHRHEYSLRAAALHSQGKLISSGLWRDVTPRARRRQPDVTSGTEDTAFEDAAAAAAAVGDENAAKVDLSKYPIHRRWSRGIATQGERINSSPCRESFKNQNSLFPPDVSPEWNPGVVGDGTADGVGNQDQDSFFGPASEDTWQLCPIKEGSSSSLQPVDSFGIDNPSFDPIRLDEEAPASTETMSDLSPDCTSAGATESAMMNSSVSILIDEGSPDGSPQTGAGISSDRAEESTTVDVEVHSDGEAHEAPADEPGENETRKEEGSSLEGKPSPHHGAAAYDGRASVSETDKTENAQAFMPGSTQDETEQQPPSKLHGEFTMHDINITFPENSPLPSIQVTKAPELGTNAAADNDGDETKESQSNTNALTFGQPTLKSSLEMTSPSAEVEATTDGAPREATERLDKVGDHGDKPGETSTAPLPNAHDNVPSTGSSGGQTRGQSSEPSSPDPASSSQQDSPRKLSTPSWTFHRVSRNKRQVQGRREKPGTSKILAREAADGMSCYPTLRQLRERGVTAFFLAMSAVVVLTYLPCVVVKLVVAMETSDVYFREFLGFRLVVRLYYLLPSVFPVLLYLLQKFWI